MSPFNGKKYAAKTISRRSKAFIKEKQGTLSSSDIEYLHRMRVASRRFRNGLWTFRELMPKKSYKAVRRSFGKV
ncbi:MAG: CHAD domain-containing protein, partial [Candidatus Omnitrophica bacterium]|nr:CHAD domain-containing protein [Candidatus Omnitrophota bacterium]